jgi:hypothetical protein
MTTARQTIGNILGSVNSVASTLTTTFSTLEGGMLMAHELVINAQRHQKIRNAALECNFEEHLALELATERATIQNTILKQRNSDKEFGALFDTAYSEIKTSITEAKSKL